MYVFTHIYFLCSSSPSLHTLACQPLFADPPQSPKPLEANSFFQKGVPLSWDWGKPMIFKQNPLKN